MNTSAWVPDTRNGNEEGDPALNPMDDWGPDPHYAQITGQIKVSGRKFITGTTSLSEIFVARVDKSGQARLVCLMAAKDASKASTKGRGAELVAINPVDQYLIHSKAASAPLTYAFDRPGIQTLSLILAKRDREPRLAFLKGELGSLALLYAAIEKGHMDGVAYLLDRKVDPNPGPNLLQSNYDKKTPLSDLLQGDGPISRGALTTPIAFAVENRQFIVSKLLLEGGADPNSGNSYGAQYAPLYPAASHQDIKMVKLLLDHGANPLGVNAGAVILENQHQVELLQILKDYGLDRPEESAAQMTRCEAFPSGAMPSTCLPRVLKSAVVEVEKRTEFVKTGEGVMDKARIEAEVTRWENTRDRVCDVQLKEKNRDGWISYLLTDTKRAKCVLSESRQRVAALAPK
jgi:hypothetical protein